MTESVTALPQTGCTPPGHGSANGSAQPGHLAVVRGGALQGDAGSEDEDPDQRDHDQGGDAGSVSCSIRAMATPRSGHQGDADEQHDDLDPQRGVQELVDGPGVADVGEPPDDRVSAEPLDADQPEPEHCQASERVPTEGWRSARSTRREIRLQTGPDSKMVTRVPTAVTGSASGPA